MGAEATTVGEHAAQPDDSADWDGDGDPANPLNWPSITKASNLSLLSTMAFITYSPSGLPMFVPGMLIDGSRPLASSMFAPAISRVMDDFHSTDEFMATFSVSVYLIGYGFGPLLFAPLSETYGRVIIYHVTNVLYVVFTVACAVAPSLDSLTGFRFLAGSAGSACLVLGAGSVADMYPRERRGSKMTAFVLGPLMGPVVGMYSLRSTSRVGINMLKTGPIAGAFISQDLKWRWIFWILTIAAGVVTVACLFFLRESYAPVLLARKAAKLRTHADSAPSVAADLKPGAALLNALLRPAKMFFLSTIVLVSVLYMSIIYGYLYLLFTTLTEVYEDTYGFSTGIAGLSFLGLGVGMVFGLGVFGATSDKRMRKKKEEVGEVEPEFHLQALIPAAVCIPVGLVWYGWSAEKKVHWIMPILGTAWVGFAMMGVFFAVQMYLIDCYPLYVASVTAANTVIRSLVGAFLPLAGKPLYTDLGLGWGNTVLAFIALAMVPLPFVFLRYGAWLRTHPRFQIKL
ncbi:hypothetical protein A1O7_09025 [Cladophialophora yegresii CBS 114405]|uniref:Major facilitator superfamily (MFS) profile domain-containing protein n=1 Tax=Cladophialophora yegresii CBS 114405 TaxID=1182544 RepID=W9WC40_9EURO|nr:uncharacterized protein A1O7_09025 [Cladophialophora yegresii CBS 114405]EXJ56094.1 hypothetical protein A1O7_09025 [Cladophialophora yegresii CBS 114405]